MVKTSSGINTDSMQESPVDFAGLLQEQLTNTEKRINVCNQEDAELLKSRAKFIKSELLAANFSGRDDEDDYWSDICKRMTDIFPTGKQSNSDGDHIGFTELGDIDDEDSGQMNEPPVLEDNIAIDSSVETKSADQESDLEEFTRLRKIAERQHNAIADLKQVLSEQNLDDEVKTVLENKVEKAEVAQAQLSMSIASLDTEIFSLESQLKAQAFDLDNYQSMESNPSMLENSVDDSLSAESINHQTDVIEDEINTTEPNDHSMLKEASTKVFDESENGGDLSTPIPSAGNDELDDIEISTSSTKIDTGSVDSTAESKTAEADTPANDESDTAVSNDDDGDLSIPITSDDNDELGDIEISEINAEIDALTVDPSADSETAEIDTPANDESMPSNLDTAIDEMLDLTSDNSSK